MTNPIERERANAGGRYYIPAPIVYAVIAGLVLAAIGGGGTGLVTAFKFNQALDKLNALPSAKSLVERRRTQRDLDHRQSQRIGRLEQAVFDMQPFKRDATACEPVRPRPDPPGDLTSLRLVLHEKRRLNIVEGQSS